MRSIQKIFSRLMRPLRRKPSENGSQREASQIRTENRSINYSKPKRPEKEVKFVKVYISEN